MNIPVRFLLAITDFGDSAVISFGTLSACVILAATGERREAWRFFATMTTAAAIIAVAKMYFIGCGNAYSRALHIYSPSGHAALTTAFCGGLAVFAAAHRSHVKQAVIWLGAVTAIMCISLSRVLLGYHSTTEIIMGFAVGCAAVLTMQRMIPYAARDGAVANQRQFLLLIVGVAVVGLGVHGHHFPAEHIIRYVARRIHRYIPACATG